MSSNSPAVQDLIAKLGLKKHPIENGYMSDVTYASSRSLTMDDGRRHVALADTVHFLYERGDFAPWHRMRTSDELWIHQAGGTLTIYIVDESTVEKCVQIERLVPYGGVVKIPAGCWFAVEMEPDLGGYCLATVLLCPGFDKDDFQMADRLHFDSLLRNETDRKLAARFFSDQ